jgi:hypothetical protein
LWQAGCGHGGRGDGCCSSSSHPCCFDVRVYRTWYCSRPAKAMTSEGIGSSGSSRGRCHRGLLLVRPVSCSILQRVSPRLSQSYGEYDHNKDHSRSSHGRAERVRSGPATASVLSWLHASPRPSFRSKAWWYERTHVLVYVHVYAPDTMVHAYTYTCSTYVRVRTRVRTYVRARALVLFQRGFACN